MLRIRQNGIGDMLPSLLCGTMVKPYASSDITCYPMAWIHTLVSWFAVIGNTLLRWNLLVTWDYVLAWICLVGVLMFGMYKYTSIPPFLSCLLLSSPHNNLFPVLSPVLFLPCLQSRLLPCRSFWNLISHLVLFLPVSLVYYLPEFNILLPWILSLFGRRPDYPVAPPMVPLSLCSVLPPLLQPVNHTLLVPASALVLMSWCALPLGLGSVRNTYRLW